MIGYRAMIDAHEVIDLSGCDAQPLITVTREHGLFSVIGLGAMGKNALALLQ